jgi:hypothetical protein
VRWLESASRRRGAVGGAWNLVRRRYGSPAITDGIYRGRGQSGELVWSFAWACEVARWPGGEEGRWRPTELDEEGFGGIKEKRGCRGSVQGMEARVWHLFIAVERRGGGGRRCGFLEGFGHYGEEKRWGAVTFRVLERRWRGGLVPIHYRWPEASGRRAHATWWWCEGGGGGRCREAGDELEWVGGPEWATG